MKQLTNLINFLFKFAVVGLALAFLLLNVWPGAIPGLNHDRNAAENTDTVAVDSPRASYAGAVNRAAPSVVSIYTETTVVQQLNPSIQRITGAPPRRLLRFTGLGSGVIMSSDGYIVTNNHVIRGWREIKVALWDGRVAQGEVVGTDPNTDLAVLKIDLVDLPVAPISGAGELKVGDVVLAIGNAAGLSHTVTMGIISATGRSEVGRDSVRDFIQTDAAINRGNSGGALINAAGDLVGINTSSLDDFRSGAYRREVIEGISFAIPIQLASEIIDEIVEYGTVRRGWLGAVFSGLPLRRAGTNSAPAQGLLVEQVSVNSPAYEAGIRQGDIILSANGKTFASPREFLLDVSEMQPGTELELEALRNGESFSARAVLIQQPPQQPLFN